MSGSPQSDYEQSVYSRHGTRLAVIASGKGGVEIRFLALPHVFTTEEAAAIGEALIAVSGWTQRVLDSS